MDMTTVANRVTTLERFCQIAEATYEQNPLDAENLTNWGGALMEIAEQKSDRQEGRRMLNDAISKMEEALSIDPKRHDTLWLLGNAYISEGFAIADLNEARGSFDRASVYFQQALDEDPRNVLYKKCLELPAKAPALHMEVHKNGSGQHAMGEGTSTSSDRALGLHMEVHENGSYLHAMEAGGPSTSGVKESNKKKNEDAGYKMFGWIVLGVGIVVWVGYAKFRAQKGN